MIRRLYVHNYRCFENFELNLSGLSSALLIGKNGSGKSTVAHALEVLQKISRGTNRIGQLVKPLDFGLVGQSAPMRFELDVEVANHIYRYALALELPDGFSELRVLAEALYVDDAPVFTRNAAQVEVQAAHFQMDWHMLALPLIQGQPGPDFKLWLSRLAILRPIPSLIEGSYEEESLQPSVDATNVGAWLGGILKGAPAAYAKVYSYLKELMPDFSEIRVVQTGEGQHQVVLRFQQNGNQNKSLTFARLSDGEKCFVISAALLAAQDAYGPITCFWDEPDTHLAIDEVGHFMTALRRSALSGGQFICTSHHQEGIRSFSADNTLVLFRRGHLEPTIVRPLSEVNVNGDLIGALTRGDLEP